MSDDQCSCCGVTGDRETNHEWPDGRWILGPAVLEAELPTDLATALSRLLGGARVHTLDDWVAEVRHRTGGGPIAVADLCRVNGESSHWGELDGERYHFACFYDAVVLAALADDPVDIRTESPEGAVIEARAAGSSDLTVTPEEAVFSFGVAEDVDPPSNDGPTHADVYAAVCPYVRAFPDPDAYGRWAGAVPAATVAMPLAGATELAAALVK